MSCAVRAFHLTAISANSVSDYSSYSSGNQEFTATNPADRSRDWLERRRIAYPERDPGIRTRYSVAHGDEVAMSRNSSLAGLILLVLLGPTLPAQSLDLPPRQPSAPKGSAFALSIAALPLEEREQKILAEVKAGNVPPFLRKLVPVAVSAGTFKASYFVAPDYLAIGSDDDFFLTPLSPLTAQAIADRLDSILPTPKMVDDIYAAATVKLSPAPIPPSPAMTSVAVFLRHNEIVRAVRGEKPPGPLVAGHKKDVVIANRLFKTPGKVAIYGWHKPDGKPIQPLYMGHSASHVDYSHGIRLVSRQMMVNGVATTIEEVLADPDRAPLLSNEGPMPQTRYQRPDSAPSLKAAPGASSGSSAAMHEETTSARAPTVQFTSPPGQLTPPLQPRAHPDIPASSAMLRHTSPASWHHRRLRAPRSPRSWRLPAPFPSASPRRPHRDESPSRS